MAEALRSTDRPDMLAIVRQHIPKDRYRDDGESIGTACTCGEWEGNYFADGEQGPFDHHLAAMIDEALDAWLNSTH